MIGVARTGQSFGGLAHYLVSGRREHSADRLGWLEVRNLITDEPDQMARIMSATANRNARAQKPVYHLSVSFAREDVVDRSTMLQVADGLLQDLGLEEHQVLIVAHRDTAHPHLHLMINRVHPETGKAWHTGHGYRRIDHSLQRLERRLGLQQVSRRRHPLPGREHSPRQPGDTAAEARMRSKTGRRPWSEVTRKLLAQEFADATSWADLERRLRRSGFQLRPRGRGLVVVQGGQSMKASRLRRSASAHRLAERFEMSYAEYRRARGDVVRDARALTRAAAEEARYLRQDTVWAQDEQWARSVLAHLQATHNRCRRCVHSIRAEFEALYRDPKEALRTLLTQTREFGWSETAGLFRNSPERFGRLRLRRSRATGAIHRAADSAWRYGTLRLRRGELAQEAGAARAALARVQSARADRGRRASPRGLELRILESSLRLGTDALQLALRPTPTRLARLLLRGADLHRNLTRQPSGPASRLARASLQLGVASTQFTLDPTPTRLRLLIRQGGQTTALVSAAQARPSRRHLEARLARSSSRLGVDSLRFVLTPTPLRLARLALRGVEASRSLLTERRP